MSSSPGSPTAHPSRRLVVGLAVAAAAGATVLVMSASADAAPESDSQGYLESTARCSSPATAVIFGSTETSRIAICEQSDGSYQYRGVRVRDGARMVLPASATDDGYVAENDGLSYTVTTESLVVSAGDEVIRDESLLDVHKSDEFSEVTTSTTQTSTTQTSTTPLPPPLPAEVGAG